jgi:hypothetical protein
MSKQGRKRATHAPQLICGVHTSIQSAKDPLLLASNPDTLFPISAGNDETPNGLEQFEAVKKGKSRVLIATLTLAVSFYDTDYRETVGQAGKKQEN